MNKKKVLALMLSLGLAVSTSLIGCNDDIKKAGEDIKNGAEDVGDAAKNGIEDIGNDIDKMGEKGVGLWDKVKDMSMTYNEDDFENEIEKMGYKLIETDDSKSLFSVENDDYTINGDKISVYEYNESAKSTLEADLKSITDNGMMINGNKVNWSKTPHIYKKGRIVVIYDGNSESILTALKEILGEPLL